MGGFGSGRHAGLCEKRVTADFLRLDVRLWRRQKLLYLGNEFGGVVRSDDRSQGHNGARNFILTTGLGYSLRVNVYLNHLVVTDLHAEGAAGSTSTVIALERTPCTLGGWRVWFRCPRPTCGRRAAILFLAGDIRCRKCARLTYESQYLSRFSRNLLYCQMIRRRLGGAANLLEPFPERPKGMRRAQYRRLWGRASDAETFCWSALGSRFVSLKTIEDTEGTERFLGEAT
jgi:hypothetical protein